MPNLSTIGYHVSDITKGELGELSKIQEEISEAIDADEQGCSVMILSELSDVIGAIEMYLEKHHSSISIQDLIKMNAITKRAFETGRRK